LSREWLRNPLGVVSGAGFALSASFGLCLLWYLALRNASSIARTWDSAGPVLTALRVGGLFTLGCFLLVGSYLLASMRHGVINYVTIQAQILELMKNLSRAYGVSLIIITHNLGVVARYADRVNIMYAGKIIERGTARDIYRNPSHPYTLGLLNSVPRLDLPRKEKLEPVEGQPPDLINLPPGCAFRERCRFAIDRCAEEIPSLQLVGDGHISACFAAETLVSRAEENGA
jgi:oligopeptide/dipeptide ABC transporter ATP-binding protein